MRTSTAFAVLALLAAGTGAIPVGRRDESECPCELLDPHNAGKTVNDDGAALLAGNNGQGESLLANKQILGGSKDNSQPQDVAQADDKDMTVTIPHGSVADDTTDDADPTIDSLTSPEGGNVRPAFRLAQPVKPTTDKVTDQLDSEDDSSDPAGDLNFLSLPPGGDLNGDGIDNTVQGGEKALSVDKPVESALPGDKKQDKVSNVGDKVGNGDLDTTAKEGEKALGVKDPVDNALPGDKTADKVDNALTPSGQNDNSSGGAGDLLKAGKAVDDAVTKHTGTTTNDHLDNAANKPVGQTVNGVSSGTGDKATDAANGPLSDAAEPIIPGSGSTAHDAAHGPVSSVAEGVIPGPSSTVQDAADGPTTHAGKSILPGSGSTLQDAANKPADQTINGVSPGTGSKIKDAANGPLSHAAEPVIPGSGSTVNDAAHGPVSPLADGIIPGSGPAVEEAADRPVGQSVGDALSGNDHVVDHVTGSDQSNPVSALTAVGAPLVSSGKVPNVDLAVSVHPSKTQSSDNQAQPQQQQQQGLSDPVNPLVAPVTGALTNGKTTDTVKPVGSTILGGVVSPLSGGNTVNGDTVKGAGDKVAPALGGVQALTNGGNGGLAIVVSGAKGAPVVNTLSQPQGNPVNTGGVTNGVSDIASPGTFGKGKKLLASVKPVTGSQTKPDVKGTNQDVKDGEDTVIDDATDGLAKENVKACKGCIDNAIEPENSKLDDAGNLVDSDPLHLEPATESPESQLPVSPECLTSPISQLPDHTIPCLTNWGGRMDSDVDVCITQDQMQYKPTDTVACPDYMQDSNLGDDLGLLRRDDNDAEWDILSRDVAQFVRLCMASNGM